MVRAEPELIRAVARACGAAAAAVVRPIPTMGSGSGVFEFDVDERRVIVKDQPQTMLVDIEVWGLERLAALGLRVPDVIAVDTTRDVHPRGFFVMEHVAGVPLNQLEKRADDALVELGQQLRVIHDEPAERFGLLGASGAPGVGVYPTLSEATRAFLEFGLSGLEKNGWIDPESGRRIRALFDSHKTDLDLCPPRLLHGDVKAEHVLVDPATGRLAGVIDPHPQAGEPAYDLARLVATGGEHIRAPLLSGYGGTRKELEARWKLHELGFLLAITFGHRIHSGDKKADPSAWNDRLLTALRSVSESD